MMPPVETFDGKQAIAEMDSEQLETVVSRALAESVTVTEWHITLLGELDDSPFAGGVYKVAVAGYLAGLRAAGWAGDEALIWEAYGCAMPLRYAPVSLASMLRTAVDPPYATEWEQKTGKPLADILAHRAGLVRFYLSRLEA